MLHAKFCGEEALMANGVILKKSKVKKGGRTARRWDYVPSAEIICEAESEGVGIQFSINSKGGGTLDIRVSINSKDFTNILGEMGKAERMETMLSMSKQLALLVSEQPTQDAITVKKAQDAVVKAAENKALYASSEAEDIEELVAKRVKTLVYELGQSPKTSSVRIRTRPNRTSEAST